jgi:hypothetical protein
MIWLVCFRLFPLRIWPEAQAGTFRAFGPGEEKAADPLEKTDLAGAAAAWAGLIIAHAGNYPPRRREMQ